jgi:hypothetical protein
MDTDAIAKLAADAAAVRNFPLAALCRAALGGDPAAEVRVTAIAAGRPDPGGDRPADMPAVWCSCAGCSREAPCAECRQIMIDALTARHPG